MTISMTVVIHRALAGYCVFSIAASTPAMVAQFRTTAPWWSAVFVPLLAALVVGMLVGSIRRRPIQRLAGAYAAACLLALLTGRWAFEPRTEGSASWLWWLFGQAVVAAGVWGGVAAAAGYGVVVGCLYGYLRTRPEFGGSPLEIGVSDALFLLVAGLPIAVTAIGMMRAGAAADLLAAEISRRALDEELVRATGAERSRLDRLIHDDVLTTLTAAAHADDDVAIRSARDLAVATLLKVDALHDETELDGRLPGDVLVRLAEATVARITPLAELRTDVDLPLSSVWVSSEPAEAVLAAVREAVRNAVRHARAVTITVWVRFTETGAQPAGLTFDVIDDGLGFQPDDVDERRLGVRLSILGRLHEVGGRAAIESTPGSGTTVTLSIPAERAEVPPPTVDEPTSPALPAEFPVRLLTTLTWLVVVIQAGQGVFYLAEMAHPWASSLGMILIALVMAALLHAGSSLRLPGWCCVGVALLATTAGALSAYALPLDHWPGYGFWLPFILQLIVVITILRQRLGTAILVTVGAGVPLGWWAVSSQDPLAGVFTVHLSVVVFGVMAWFVNRGLLEIARRQAELRRQEVVALRRSARLYVGRVQRALWVDDLRVGASDLLLAISTAEHPLSSEAQAECLVVEATLRESLFARNVVNEELAELIEDARRRGVSVTLVDSRRTPAPPAVRRAVLTEITRALRSRTVSRVVVRVAPEESERAASVVTAGRAGTRLTTIDGSGTSSSDGVETPIRR